VYLVIVFLSVILPMLLLSSKLKRNLIIDQNFNIGKHCNFCGGDDHLESKYFKKLDTLQATMKRHNINLDPPSNSFFHALSIYCFSFNATYTTSNEWLVGYGASYHISKDKGIFFALNECNTKMNICW
jgi:hypothetical protein